MHRVAIHYCPKCRWLPRAAWVAQELLDSLGEHLAEVALGLRASLRPGGASDALRFSIYWGFAARTPLNEKRGFH